MSNYSATYNVYAVSDDGTLTVQSSSVLGQDVEVSDPSAVLDGHGSFQATGFDGPFDGNYTFVSKVSGSGGTDGFLAKDSHGHTYFFADGTVDGTSQTLNTESGSVPICFLQGTAIRTPDGEVPVETLKVGDVVTTADGRQAPVCWIGRQAVARAFAETAQLPICIRADAISPQVPSRDLYLSASHAVLIDGALIQAGCLVNGTSVTRMLKVPSQFTYYHVELDEHGLILANDTPAETFIDNVDRARFDNWDEHEIAAEASPAMVEMSLPRAKAHRQVPRLLRDRLDRRGLALYGVATAEAA